MTSAVDRLCLPGARRVLASLVSLVGTKPMTESACYEDACGRRITSKTFRISWLLA